MKPRLLLFFGRSLLENNNKKKERERKRRNKERKKKERKNERKKKEKEEKQEKGNLEEEMVHSVNHNQHNQQKYHEEIVGTISQLFCSFPLVQILILDQYMNLPIKND